MKVENSLQMERSAVDIALAILREADDFTAAINHWDIVSRTEEIVVVEMWMGDITNCKTVLKQSTPLKINWGADVICAETVSYTHLRAHET